MVSIILQGILQSMIAVERDLTTLDQTDLIWLRDQFASREGDVAHAMSMTLTNMTLTQEPLSPEEIEDLNETLRRLQKEHESGRPEDQFSSSLLTVA